MTFSGGCGVIGLLVYGARECTCSYLQAKRRVRLSASVHSLLPITKCLFSPFWLGKPADAGLTLLNNSENYIAYAWPFHRPKISLYDDRNIPPKRDSAQIIR